VKIKFIGTVAFTECG